MRDELEFVKSDSRAKISLAASFIIMFIMMAFTWKIAMSAECGMMFYLISMVASKFFV
jgi:hypothetical protein